MNKVVTEYEFAAKRDQLKKESERISDSIATFKNELTKLTETIEAIKLCANTYGGLKKVKELDSLDFDTKILDYIDTNISELTITETYKEELRDQSAL